MKLDWLLKTKMSSFYNLYQLVVKGSRRAGAHLQPSLGEKQGAPWTGYWFVTAQHRYTKDKQLPNHAD